MKHSFLRQHRGARRVAAGAVVVLVVALLPSTAEAAAGNITLASTADDGTKAIAPFIGGGSGGRPSISGDGTRLAFESLAKNLDPGDTDEDTDIYVKDVTTGDLILASATDAGISANGSFSAFPSLAANGQVVAFASVATNLDTADTSDNTDIYLKDLTTLDVRVVPTGDLHGYCSGNNIPSLSGDAGKVAFQSRDPLDFTVDSNGVYVSGEFDCDIDVFVKDLVRGTLTRASVSESGADGDGHSSHAALSADGTKIAFVSTSTNLVAGDTNATYDVFVKDLQTGTVTVASSTDAGVVGNGSSEGDPSISADGTRVAFRSTATNLDGASGNPDGVVYVKNLVTGDVSLASSSDAGLAANGGTDLGPDISGDGLRVSFWSRSTNLDPTDGDALADVYVKELLTGDIVVASTSDAGAKGNGASGTTTINHNGTVVGFGSAATNLDPGDTDTEGDAYVKEVGSAPDGDADGVPDDVDNCPATVNPGQEDQDGDLVGDACDPDRDGDGVLNGVDVCPTVAEDLDGNQDGDGCPEDPSHDIGATALRTQGRVTLARCAAPCTADIVIKVKSFGSHAQTDVPYAVTGGGGSATYSSACSGDAASLSADGDLDPREVIVVTGCTVTYSSPGTVSHTLRVDHGLGPTEVYADDNLSNNTRVDTTSVT